jgi:hypothetical protein
MFVVSFITAIGDEWANANAIAIASGAICLWWSMGGGLRLIL